MQDIIFTIHQDLIYILLHGEFFLESRTEELLQEIFHHRINSTPNIEYYFIALIQNDATLLYTSERSPIYVILRVIVGEFVHEITI